MEGSIRQPVIHGSALKTRTKQFQIRENFKMTHFLKMLRSQEEKTFFGLLLLLLLFFLIENKTKTIIDSTHLRAEPFFCFHPQVEQVKRKKGSASRVHWINSTSISKHLSLFALRIGISIAKISESLIFILLSIFLC